MPQNPICSWQGLTIKKTQIKTEIQYLVIAANDLGFVLPEHIILNQVIAFAWFHGNYVYMMAVLKLLASFVKIKQI